jgi:undecaprenyl diphosphate synthase
LERTEGHFRGVESVRETIKAAIKNGVEYLTLYAFSTENWGRPAAEVEALMGLICKCVRAETPELVRQGVRMRVIGEREGLADEVLADLEGFERDTKEGTNLTVMLAINYGARDEIRRAARLGGADFEDFLFTKDVPDPDLVVRTGGDMRLSNFLLWQAAYSELYFTDAYWPDFGQEEFEKALEEFARRERRYGLVK